MHAAVIIPAYEAARTVGAVVAELVSIWPDRNAILVVDDGSTDQSAARAREAGAVVLSHDHNLGKGAALRTGLREAGARGFDAAVTVDADGQHPPTEALRLRGCCPDPATLVLGIRDLGAAQAPRANRYSNRFSNFAVSGYAWKRLRDTQCGLRRYPVAATLALGIRADGYGFEAEVLIRAAAARLPIVQVPVRVLYPAERTTHFDAVRDPARIVLRVLSTFATTRPEWLRTHLGRIEPGQG